MPHDPARVADTKAWIVAAADDLKAAEYLLRSSPPLPGGAVFHCQQAAEKALKGFLAWHDVPFRKTHNLEEIGEACLAIDATLKNVIDRGAPLTEYAWKLLSRWARETQPRRVPSRFGDGSCNTPGNYFHVCPKRYIASSQAMSPTK